MAMKTVIPPSVARRFTDGETVHRRRNGSRQLTILAALTVVATSASLAQLVASIPVAFSTSSLDINDKVTGIDLPAMVLLW